MVRSADDRLMELFIKVHGNISGSCYLEFEVDDEDTAVGVNVMKDGNLCFSVTREDLMFDVMTMTDEELKESSK